MEDDDINDSHALFILVPAGVFLIVPPLFICLRWWSRLRLGGIGADDWIILASMLFAVVHGIILITACHFGFGKHKSTLKPSDLVIVLKLFWSSQIFYKLSINSTKVSILLLYVRIFVQKPFRLICNVLIGIIVAYCTASVIAGIFQCTPLHYYWDKSIPGKCIDIIEFWYANGGFSISTDAIILILPMPVIYLLRLKQRQKIALMLIFALGIFVLVTSIFRMTTLSLSARSPDTTYDILSTCWTIVECNVAIICACLPTTRPIIARIFPTMFPDTTQENRSFNRSSCRGGNVVYPNFTCSASGPWSPRDSVSNAVRMSYIESRFKNSKSDGDNKSSEEYIFSGLEEKSREEIDINDHTKVIHKTVDYSIHYSNSGDEESID